ncbi:MAG: AsmA family protein [Hyphomicrobium sp.]|uniref:AsmA family protein n=1 Tax=Hyphomicrobium sp. TaxID=82 RepID=UPI003D142234
MNNALLYLGGILITALAILFAVPRFVDWNSYRGVFEEEASRILGREVRVGGAVNVRLLPSPFVSFEKLRIADVGDDAGNSIIRVESFTMWLSVPPLLRGVLEAHRVELRRPVLNLAANAEGSGNWRSLAISPGSLPFAPKEVALQSVDIQDGAVIVSGPSRGELARFDGIDGELTAEAIEGPYKFKGEVKWDGAPRQLRFATAKMDGNGDLRFKAAVDVAGSANSYLLDAKLSDLKGVPTLEGDLTAKLNLAPGAQTPDREADITVPQPAAPAPSGGEPVLPSNAASAPATAESAKEAAPAPVVPAQTADPGKSLELKSKVKGTALGVALDDLSVTLEAGATPQIITGQAKIGWADAMRLDVSLASRWLDLDRLAQASDTAKTAPLEAARGYFEVLAAALPTEADTNALLEFDQLTLGGEAISNVRLAASRSGGPLELKGVRADLPGGVRLDLDGVLTPAEKVPHLDGTLFVTGKSLMRFLAWGLGNPEVGRDRSDGPFSLDGHFALGDGTLALTDATVDVSGTPLEGALKLEAGERRKLTVAIEGPRIDVAQFGSGLVDLGTLRQLLFGTDAAAPTETAAPAGGTAFDPAAGDLTLDLKLAELIDGERRLSDVDADIRIERGRLSIPRLKFSTPEGLYVEAQGEATDVPQRPTGTVSGLVSAPNAEAARAFASLLDTDGGSLDGLERIARLAPFRLAGTLDLKGGASNASRLAVDGTLGGGRVTASLNLAGGRGQWRTSPLDVEATFSNPDVAALVAALFDTKLALREGEAPKSGRLVVKAAGVPADGLVSLADASAEGLSLAYRGYVRLAKPGETGLDGELKVAATDARVPLSLAGLEIAEGGAGTALGGTITVVREGGILKLASDALALGANTLSGQVAVTAHDGGKSTIDASLAANKASFAALFAPLLGTDTAESALDTVAASGAAPQVKRPPAAAAGEAAPAPEIIWPDQSFDLSLLGRVDGKLALTLGSLELEPGLAMGNVRIAAELSPDGVKVASLEGDMLGGRLTSDFDMAKAPAGINLSGKIAIDIYGTTPPQGAARQPGDAVAFEATFAGRALSPASVMAALDGKGMVTVGDATLNGNSPTAVAGVVRAALTGQGPSGGWQLTEAMKGALKQGEVKLGKITIPVTVSDGALKLDKVRIDMPDGRSTFATAVELATMKIDSEWQIEPKLDAGLAAQPARAALPPVTVVYTGKLNQYATLVPQVSTEALERELVVRKLELDVGKLEQLRKEDEARARQEDERRKADEEQARIEAERRKALEEDQTPQPVPPPGPLGPDAVEREELVAPPTPDNPGVAGNGAGGVPIQSDIEAAAPPVVAPSPTSQRPPKRRKPAEDSWRPFEGQPY